MDKQPYLEFDNDDTKLEFKHHLEFTSSEEMNIMFADDNKPLSDLIVDIALENLDTTIESIPVVSIATIEDDLIYDVIIDRIDMVETLEQNLILMEDFEDYGRCQKITDALFYLNNK
jgi:hypothetical protein|tara:strand:- start:909 stop:1259 length:351 start_codon:yes stop_codon:yes gene_type:complete